MHPDWSPDGQKLAFVVDADAPRDIWVSNADGSDAHAVYLCEAPCDNVDFPDWSKDGTSILFRQLDFVDGETDGSQLLLVNVESGAVRTLAASSGPKYFSYPRFSSDEQSIVVQLDTWTDTGISSTFVQSVIAVADVSRNPATITEITAPEMLANYPDWHPTDDLIVFGTSQWPNEDNVSDLYTIKPDGSAMQLLKHDNELRLAQPTWLPDGSGVIFVGVTGTGFGDVAMWTVKADGSDLALATSDRAHFGTHPRLRPLP